MENLINSPLFGILLSVAAYYFGKKIYYRFKHPLLSPLLLATTMIVLFLLITKIDYEKYALGSGVIKMFLGPVTVVLGVSVYQKWALVKKYWIVILVSSVIGSLVSLLTVYGLAKAFALDEVLTQSLLPKSVTAAIAIPLSEKAGGIKALTVISVVITGIIGTIVNPFLIKKLRLNDKIAVGLAIGVSSHIIGTAQAKELGEIEGALSSVAIVSAGFITALIYLFL